MDKWPFFLSSFLHVKTFTIKTKLSKHTCDNVMGRRLNQLNRFISFNLNGFSENETSAKMEKKLKMKKGFFHQGFYLLSSWLVSLFLYSFQMLPLGFFNVVDISNCLQPTLPDAFSLASITGFCQFNRIHMLTLICWRKYFISYLVHSLYNRVRHAVELFRNKCKCPQFNAKTGIAEMLLNRRMNSSAGFEKVVAEWVARGCNRPLSLGMSFVRDFHQIQLKNKTQLLRISFSLLFQVAQTQKNVVFFQFFDLEREREKGNLAAGFLSPFLNGGCGRLNQIAATQQHSNWIKSTIWSNCH